MNVPTIIVSAVIAAVVVAITVSEIKKRRSGKGGCSCGCGGCALKDRCRSLGGNAVRRKSD